VRTDPGDGVWLDRSVHGRAEIHQATGMVVIQLGVSATDALARTRAYAFAEQGIGRARGHFGRRLRHHRSAGPAGGLQRRAAGCRRGRILLADFQRTLRVVASSNEDATVMELLQLQADQGPCMECFSTGVAVSVPDLADEAWRCPVFVAAVAERGLIVRCMRCRCGCAAR
jgi:hypothetical protein